MSQRVLCIESDAAIRDRLRRVLEAGGLTVEESASGFDGLARARAAVPDLVLADARLPDLEGAELAVRLKQDERLSKVPLVAVGASPEDHDMALAAGCDGFIAAPMQDDRLVDEVKAYLGGKRDRLDAGAETGACHRVAELGRDGSAFIHDLAHELSTPLTPLAGYLKILQSQRLGALSPQQAKVVEGMAAALGKLTRIVDNLADFANLEAGRAAISTSSVEPDALAEDVVNEVRPAARDARLHVQLRFAGPGPVVADARKLRQALANVVQNAVKFSPHGGEVMVEVSRDGDRLRFSVYDQGPGVRRSEMERIFEPFRHSERRDEARLPGSGLGLPVARRIAEAHGGRILVESPPHTQPSVAAHQYTGSKFVIEIPASPAAQEQSPARVSG